MRRCILCAPLNTSAIVVCITVSSEIVKFMTIVATEIGEVSNGIRSAIRALVNINLVWLSTYAI